MEFQGGEGWYLGFKGNVWKACVGLGFRVGLVSTFEHIISLVALELGSKIGFFGYYEADTDLLSICEGR